MRRPGGHLGGLVSALTDGQLPAAQTERLWHHVLTCATCRDAVERETWVKNRLAGIATTPPPSLPSGDLARDLTDRLAATSAWEVVDELERRQRLRRAGLVAAGAGSVAVIGLGAVSGVVDVPDPGVSPTQVSTVMTRTPSATAGAATPALDPDLTALSTPPAAPFVPEAAARLAEPVALLLQPSERPQDPGQVGPRPSRPAVPLP